MNEVEDALVDSAVLAAAPEGTRVVGIDGGKLGEVVAVHRDRLIVERGFFFPTDYYVPFAAVGAYEGGTIRLIVSLREALGFGWDAPPVDEPAPQPVPAEPEVPPVPPEPAAASTATVVAASEPAHTAGPTPAMPALSAVDEPATAATTEGAGGVGEEEAPPAAPPEPSVPPPAAGVTAPLASDQDAEPPTETAAPAEVAAPPEEGSAAAEAPPAAASLPGRAGGSTLSRLFPDLVGEPAAEQQGEPSTAAAEVGASPGGRDASVATDEPAAAPAATGEPADQAVAAQTDEEQPAERAEGAANREPDPTGG